MGSQVRDRISQQPDAVLSYILSFLLTKDAVRTTILSKRWKNIWASVHSLDFELKYIDKSYHMSDAGFVSFVDCVLNHRDSSDIQRFRLHFQCFPQNFALIDRWIRTAISRNVVELDICVRVMGPEKFEFPECVYLCKTLVSLNLKSNCFLSTPPESGCFTNLKFLHIRLDHPDKDLLEKLFAYFPLLEDLSLVGELFDGINCEVKLFVPKLKRLSININKSGYFEDPFEYFSINAPKLEFLNLGVDILPSMSIDNANSLVKAVVEFYYHHAIHLEHFCDRATKILASVSNIEHLSPSAHFLNVICIPAFGNLIHLKLVIHECYHWEVLAVLLKKTSNLQFLVLEHQQHENCYSDHKESSEDADDYSENEETSEDEEYSDSNL